MAAAGPGDPSALRRTLVHGLPNGLSLRDETEADDDFMTALYASTREEELAPVPWTAEDKAAFLRWQSDLQRAHYREHYPGAGFLVIERAGESIGRLYLHMGSEELRVMDIALVPAARNRGDGTAIMQAVLAAAGRPVTLHVEPDNPAQRLYARLGFRLKEQRGVYDFLEWLPG